MKRKLLRNFLRQRFGNKKLNQIWRNYQIQNYGEIGWTQMAKRCGKSVRVAECRMV